MKCAFIDRKALALAPQGLLLFHQEKGERVRLEACFGERRLTGEPACGRPWSGAYLNSIKGI